jgi:septation ring formation regulator EzrA
MGEVITNELIFETLKKVQAAVADIRNGQVDLRRDMRGLKEEAISTREEIQALRRDVLRQERGFAAIQLDMDQMKSRLEQDDDPPPPPPHG